MKRGQSWVCGVLMVLVCGCTGVPNGVVPVKDLDKTRYLGRWYEVARLENRFEKGLTQVTAEYVLRDDGGISVINRGYDAASGVWSTAKGKAYFVKNEQLGHLKVSFFGPFYSSYIIFSLGADYEYAFVCGYSKAYLWLLSRTPTVDETVLAAFKAMAQEKGFLLDDLVVSQTQQAKAVSKPPGR